jgi:hypothetical protein
MVGSIRSQTIRLRLTLTTMILLVAAIAPCFAFWAVGSGFAPVLRSAAATPALVAIVAWWSLAAALPALWIGDVRRTPPRGLLLRFAIGNSFLAILVGAWNPLFVVVLLGAAALVAAVGGSRMPRIVPGPHRVQAERAMAGLASYVVQLALTAALFLVTLVPLRSL